MLFKDYDLTVNKKSGARFFTKQFGCKMFPQIGYFVKNFGGSFTPKSFSETHSRS